jgi:hypothetical protein
MTNPTTDYFNQVYQRDPSIVSREIAGETLLVPIGHNVADLESIYLLNETAQSAWQLFDGARTLADIRKSIVQDYSVDEDQAGRDLLELAEQLEKIGAIVRL